MRAIVYARPDGRVSVASIAPGARLVDSVRWNDQVVRFEPPATADTLTPYTSAGFVPSFAESEIQFVERILLSFHEASEWICIEECTLPKDRTFRDAWRLRREELGVDIAEARQIWLRQLRIERDRLLAESDTLIQRAVETDDEKLRGRLTRIRQCLREMPKQVASQIAEAQTTDQLLAIRPRCFEEAAAALR